MKETSVSVTFTCEVCGYVNVISLPKILDPRGLEKRCQGPRCKASYRIYGTHPTIIRTS